MILYQQKHRDRALRHFFMGSTHGRKANRAGRQEGGENEAYVSLTRSG